MLTPIIAVLATLILGYLLETYFRPWYAARHGRCHHADCPCNQPVVNTLITPDNPMGRVTYKQRTEMESDGYDSWTNEVRVKEPYSKSDLISSELPNGNHAPLLDIDYSAKLVPSSTDGHFHLYLDKEVSWRDYKRVLRAMAKAGLIEKGYAKVSIQRKGTHLRLPWVKKKTPGRVYDPLKDTYTDYYNV